MGRMQFVGGYKLREDTYEIGKGKTIVEILNIGFEPLLFNNEYDAYKRVGYLKGSICPYKKAIKYINSELDKCDDKTDEEYLIMLKAGERNRKNKLEKLKRIHNKKLKYFEKLLNENVNKQRRICDNREFASESQFRNIVIFESDLTRTFDCADMQHSDDIISVVTYYTQIFDSIIHNGFDYKDKHFVFFTAGAGQTRCKKSTFVSEEKLSQTMNKLFCGLSREDINAQGGMNTNKYLAYTSLCQSNTEIWDEFDIDKAIVVDDIEYTIPNQKVRFIYTETPDDKIELKNLQEELADIASKLREIRIAKKGLPVGTRRTKTEIKLEKDYKSEKKRILEDIKFQKEKYHKISIQNIDLPIPFTDGFGISLRKMQSSMVRLPFIKGLFGYIPKRQFKDHCSENNVSIHKVTDIYGKQHSIDDVDFIFTKSQFKMYKYYNNITDDNGNVIKTGWDVYKENFKKYNCAACRCNVERNVKLNAKTNYQVLQTLTTEMTDKEIYQLAKYDIDNLNGIGSDIQYMLNVLYANPDKNNNLSYLQKSLILYPEMFKDFYVKNLLKTTKGSMIKKFRSGKFNINGAYTFAIPDTLACMQWWFTGERNLDKLGFISEGEVACELFSNGETVDCLRSPHLDHSHCIRKNIKNDKTCKWVKSKGIYLGVKDTMSKILMYDNDGDKLLVHNNKVIINCAKRFQKKYEIIPNYYEMSKASPQELNNSTLFEGIVLAYHHGNIGTPSNEITKVFMTLNPNSTEDDVKRAINVVALRCADVNYTIDFAKTLYKPLVPPDVLKYYKEYSGKKVPHFFIYAKNKTKNQVEPLGKCNIDRIENVVKSKKIVFKDLIGKYSYKNLMCNPNVNKKTDTAQRVIELYNEIHNINLRRLSHTDASVMDFDEKKKYKMLLEYDTRKQRKMFEDIIGESPEYITDVLVKTLSNDINKDTMWKLFGDVIYSNLERNLKGTKVCKKCGDRYSPVGTSNCVSEYCVDCRKEISNEKAKLRMKKHRNSA
jgi:hypothetical protein